MTALPLAVLCIYQMVMYGLVVRAYLHVSVVLIPWLLAEGGSRLYESINVNYPPGWLWFNAAFYRLLPDHPLRLRLGTVMLALAMTLLIYALARRWWGARAGLAGAALFAAWGPLMLEYLLYFEFALGLLALGALALWQDTHTRPAHSVAAGVLVGLAALVKPHGLALAAAFALNVTPGRPRRFNLLGFAIGALLPLSAAGLALAMQGTLERGLFMTTAFNLGYVEAGAAVEIGLREGLLLALLFALVPLYLVLAWRTDERGRALLLLLLLAALCTPAFPRYGRFHLAGALPLVALVGAGALHLARRPLPRLYARAAFAGALAVGIGLPLYYRAALGEIDSQYAALLPLAAWVTPQIEPGVRVWIAPDIDPTGNFYPISGLQPPAVHLHTYPWYLDQPDLAARFAAAWDADPPRYVIQIDDWRFQVPPDLLARIEAGYTPIARTTLPNELNAVTLYARRGG